MIRDKSLRTVVTNLLSGSLLAVTIIFSLLTFGEAIGSDFSRGIQWLWSAVLMLMIAVVVAIDGKLLNRLVLKASNDEIVTSRQMVKLYGQGMRPRGFKRFVGPPVLKIAGWMRSITMTAVYLVLMILAVFGDSGDAVLRFSISWIVAISGLAILRIFDAVEDRIARI